MKLKKIIIIVLVCIIFYLTIANAESVKLECIDNNFNVDKAKRKQFYLK